MSSTTSPTLMAGRGVAELGSAFVSDVIDDILAGSTDTMTGGQLRRLQELAEPGSPAARTTKGPLSGGASTLAG